MINQDKHVVLIPHWIAETLERNGLALVDALDLQKLLKISSRDDILGYMALNRNIDKFFGLEGVWDQLHHDFWSRLPAATFARVEEDKNHSKVAPDATIDNNVVYDIQYHTNPGVTPTERDSEALAELTSLETLSYDEAYVRSVSARLFDEGGKTDRYPAPFIAYDLTREVCGVVVYPGHFIEGHVNAYAEALIESVLKIFFGTLPENVVYSTAYFKRYLQLLRSNSVIV